MNWPVTIRPEATVDLQQARDWYENRRTGLGDAFLADTAEALLRLEADPGQFPEYYRGFRRIFTHRFPYKIFFRIIPLVPKLQLGNGGVLEAPLPHPPMEAMTASCRAVSKQIFGDKGVPKLELGNEGT